MSMGWWLTLLLVLPTFGMASWMWWVMARFNLDNLSLGELSGMTLEDGAGQAALQPGRL